MVLYFILMFIFLVFLGAIVLLCGVFEFFGYGKHFILYSLLVISLVLLMALFFLLMFYQVSGVYFFLYHYFYVDSLVLLTFKFLVVFFFSYILVVRKALVQLSYPYEYLLFIWFVFIGLWFVLSSYDFLILYLGMEFSTLSFYILVSYNNNSLRSAEAGLKYFILGSLSSAFYLYGMVIIYGFAGTLNFGQLYLLFQTDVAQLDFYAQFILASGFILVSFLFKLGVFPFHTWVPDIYAGASVLTVSFLGTIPKLVYIVVFFKLFFFVFVRYLDFFYGYFLFVAIFSLVVGVLGSLGAFEFRRLLGYSSIVNFGLVFFVLAGFTYSGIISVFFFVCLYIVMLFLVFSILIGNLVSRLRLESIYDLVDCGGSSKKMLFMLCFFFLSFAGMPPFAGFYGKVMLLQSIVSVSNVLINFLVFFIVVVVTSVIVFVYLRLVGIIWFGGNLRVPFFLDRFLYFIVLCGSFFNCLFGLWVPIFYSKLYCVILKSSIFCI